MEITVSIVIYNENKETLKRIIDNIISIKYQKELIILDNSPVDTLKETCSKYSGVKYIFNGENIGFGAGHNVAFKNISSKSDIHLVVNPDVYFDVEVLEGFLEWFDSTTDIALALPKILNTDGSTQNVVRNIPTPLSLIKRKLKIEEDEIAIADNEIVDIPFAHGCFMAFKRECFEKIGGFDERFFLYMEDIDIFIKAKKCARTVINTNYAIYHEHRKGSSKSLKLLKLHLISAWKFFLKYKNTK